MFLLFNLLLLPLLPALGLYTLYRRFIQKKSDLSFKSQWGYISPEMREFGRGKGPKIWVHAVSVGETMAAKSMVRALKEEIPGLQVALSSTTDAGHDLALNLLKNGEVDCAFYFGLDLPLVQIKVLHALRPNALAFVETELWPNLLHLARKRQIPTFLINGRVSDNLLKTAPKLGPFWKWMSGNMSRFLMRGEVDAARLQELGVADKQIVVTGDVKLEAPPVSSATLRQSWREKLGLSHQPLIIAGSTHPGEEEILLQAYSSLLTSNQNLKLAIAPRHIDRTDEVIGIIEKLSFTVVLRSKNEKMGERSVYLLDTVGELSDFYAASDVSFVGGSLIPRGGHNVLEPVLRGAPVLFGPYMMNFRAAAELVTANHLGEEVSTTNLAESLSFWLNPDDRENFEGRVSAALAPHQGAAKRMAQQVAAAIQ